MIIILFCFQFSLSLQTISCYEQRYGKATKTDGFLQNEEYY